MSTSFFACAHCGTGFNRLSPTQLYCCSGCEVVSQLIHDEGLGDYYRLREDNPPVCPLPAQVSTETYEFCDDPEFIAKASPDGRSLTFYLEGLNCTACLWLLEKLPQLCTSVATARVNMSASTISVERHPDASFAEIARTLNRLGHRPHPVRGNEETDQHRKRERHRDLVRIGVAGAATGNIMILAVSLYGGAEGALANQFKWVSAILAFPVLTWCAWPFYQSALGALRGRQLNIDVPIVAALVAGIIMSAWGLITGLDTLYFDSLSMLVFLLLSSRFWLRSMQQQYLDVSHLEDELLTGTVTRFGANGEHERVSTLSLRPGDRVEIDGNMTVPADGIAVSGSGYYQTAALTGEADAHELALGREIQAGSRNLTGNWVLEVKKAANESRLAGILRDIEQAAQSKPQIVLFSNRVSHWFVGIVMSLAAIISLYFMISQPQEGFSRALALVIVTCPCVFGMAIPLSVSLGIRAAARSGIIIKEASAFERLLQLRRFNFDKTGTLTRGEMRVLLASFEPGEESSLQAIASLENNQPHPVARALLKYAADHGVEPKEATDVRALQGGGLEGVVKGVLYSIRPLGLQTGAASEQMIHSSYGFFRDKQMIARFNLGDELRPEAKGLIEWARSQNFALQLLSGDRASTVSEVGKKLGFNAEEIKSALAPEEKSSMLKAQGALGAMVGDGANDAAALASAGVGIAVSGSMEASLRAADIYLMTPDLRSLPHLFKIAKRTRGAIIRNLAFSASFNVVAGGLAIAGLMTPLWAAVLMPLSSLTVLLSAIHTGRRLEAKPSTSAIERS